MRGESGDLQRPHGNRGLPAGVPRGERAIAATSPWTAGPDTAWWREDSATSAGTSTPPWRTDAPIRSVALLGGTPTTAGPLDPSATDARPAVTTATTGTPRAATTEREPRTKHARERSKPARNPAVGLASLLLLSLLAAFFAWVSAEPLWLAIGHGKTGSATVTRCTGSGIQQRCVGTFTAGGSTTEEVRLLGVDERQRIEGTQVTARMIDGGGRSAYVGSGARALHLRWALGLTLVMLCGFGMVWGTGALRLTDRRSRRRATIAALAAPLLVAVGFFAAAF